MLLSERYLEPAMFLFCRRFDGSIGQIFARRFEVFVRDRRREGRHAEDPPARSGKSCDREAERRAELHFPPRRRRDFVRRVELRPCQHHDANDRQARFLGHLPDEFVAPDLVGFAQYDFFVDFL